jgi:hypothetical protein
MAVMPDDDDDDDITVDLWQIVSTSARGIDVFFIVLIFSQLVFM